MSERSKWRQCALPGCEKIFHPRDDDHRYCDLSHAREADGLKGREDEASLSKKRLELKNAMRGEYEVFENRMMRCFDRLFHYAPRKGEE